MDMFKDGWTFSPIPTTGVQIIRNRWTGAMDAMTDDGFGNLVPATPSMVIFFLSQEH